MSTASPRAAYWMGVISIGVLPVDLEAVVEQYAEDLGVAGQSGAEQHVVALRVLDREVGAEGRELFQHGRPLPRDREPDGRQACVRSLRLMSTPFFRQ